MLKKLKTEELHRHDISSFKKTKKTPVVVVLDNVRSMHNIGSVFRTCDAFAIESIYLCGITASPPHREITKSALGAEKSVDWKHYDDVVKAVEFLKPNYLITLIEQTNKSQFLQAQSFSSNRKYAFIFGNEISGVSDTILHLADNTLEIPQFGIKHSFNISVSIGIVLWTHFMHTHT